VQPAKDEGGDVVVGHGTPSVVGWQRSLPDRRAPAPRRSPF
jgi:hypothetical protein